MRVSGTAVAAVPVPAAAAAGAQEFLDRAPLIVASGTQCDIVARSMPRAEVGCLDKKERVRFIGGETSIANRDEPAPGRSWW